MDNRGILAFSAISLNFIFLVWCTTTFTGLNYIYVLMTLTFMLFANLVNRNYKKLPRDLLFTLINCLCIYVVNLLYNYLVNEYTSIFLLILLGLLMLFVFLYYIYTLFKLLNEVVQKDKYLQKKDYKKV